MDNKTLDFGEIQINVKFEPDYDADLDHYGVFVGEPPRRGLYVDRKHGIVTGEELFDECIQRVYKVPWWVYEQKPTEHRYEYLMRVKDYAWDQLENDGYPGATIMDGEWEYDEDDSLLAVVASGYKAAIDGLDRMGRNEYRYFVEQDNWLAYEKNPTAEQIQEAAQHTADAYNRCMEYEKGYWSMYKFTVKVELFDAVIGKAKGYNIENDWDESDINECVGEKIDEAVEKAMKHLEKMGESFKWVEAGLSTIMERVQL